MKEHITEHKALNILKAYAPSEKELGLVLTHSRHVQEIALRTSKNVPGADLAFIASASLLHDIGRFRYPPGTPNSIRHGIAGHDILMRQGLPEHARVCKVHIGIGISREDIQGQGLEIPLEEMMPSTVEEKIITYADNLTYREQERTEKWVEDRFAEEIGEHYRQKVRDFHREIHKLIKS